MSKIAVIYWPKKGSTEKAAQTIYKKLGSGKADIFSLSQISPSVFNDYKFFIVGGNTVGADNWEDAHKGERWGPFYASMKEQKISLKGKKLALFGLGDQVRYPEHFVNDMKLLYDYFGEFQAEFVGYWPVDGYEHTDSSAVIGDVFVGLALDEDNQSNLTNERIDLWLNKVVKEFER
jgi:flavodoxin I